MAVVVGDLCWGSRRRFDGGAAGCLRGSSSCAACVLLWHVKCHPNCRFRDGQRLGQGKSQIESQVESQVVLSLGAKQKVAWEEEANRPVQRNMESKGGKESRHPFLGRAQQINKTFTWNHFRRHLDNENTRMEMKMQQCRRHQTNARLTRLLQTGNRSRCLSHSRAPKTVAMLPQLARSSLSGEPSRKWRSTIPYLTHTEQIAGRPHENLMLFPPMTRGQFAPIVWGAEGCRQEISQSFPWA